MHACHQAYAVCISTRWSVGGLCRNWYTERGSDMPQIALACSEFHCQISKGWRLPIRAGELRERYCCGCDLPLPFDDSDSWAFP